MNRATALLCLSTISIGALLAADAPVKPPVLSVEQKFKLKNDEVAALKTNAAFSALMQKIQSQVETLSEYKQAKEAADTAAARYQTTVRETLTAVKCPECNLNTESLTLVRPPAPPAAPTPPAAK